MPQKDPAILFYFDHWRGGTMTMSRFLKGAYMDLLDAQFNNGHLSLEEIKTVLGTDFSAWGSLTKKFAADEAGKYFNKRLELEMLKRKAFSEKQKERVNKRWNKSGIDSGNTTVLPSVNINVNENIIQEEEKGVGKGEGFFLNEKVMEDLTKVEINAVKSFIHAACQKKIIDVDVIRAWDAFRINNQKNHEWYGSHEKLMIHFRHSLKNELNKPKNGTTQSTNGHGAGLSGNAIIRPGKTFDGTL